MAQDLKKRFREVREAQAFRMPEGHEARFMARLEEECPQGTKKDSGWKRVAVAAVVLLGAGLAFYLAPTKEGPIAPEIVESPQEAKSPAISLGDLSPDMKKIEQFYTAHINMELARLEISDDNKELIDSYMERMAELDAEYQRLTLELNELGPNEDTVAALIKNLQLRLELMKRLQAKLKELKSTENEQQAAIL